MIGKFAALAASLHCLAAVQGAEAASVIKHVFVITMENKDARQIYGHPELAPYINNTLMPGSARATNFIDPLLKLDSEPHYIWMEAGTNVFSDHTFSTDADASAKNSTASKDHLVTQMENDGTVKWMTYQEDVPSGVCPIKSAFPYAAKHNPFVFFQDVSGKPPNPKNEFCIKHTKPYSAFAADLAANQMANYVFITPNICHDMHGDKLCTKPGGVPMNPIAAGDTWLKAELPRIIDWVTANSGVIFIMWDESKSKNEKNKIPFLAIGPGVKLNFPSDVAYDHGSLVKSIEEIFNLPILPKVAAKNNFKDMFEPGAFP